MLLRNGLSTNVLPLSLLGAGWQNFVHDSAVMNQSNSEGFTKLSSYSMGLYPPHSMIPPRTAGRMVAHQNTTATFTLTGSGTLGKNADVTISTSILISQAALALIVGGTASIPISIQITPNPVLLGSLAADSSIPFSLVVNASIGAINGANASLTFSLTPAGSIASADGYMSAIISSQGDELSPTSLAAAVWNAVAAIYNTAGTMGNKMNSAASAGDPWTTPLPGGYLAGTAGQIIGSLENDINLHTDSAVATQQALLELASFGEAVHLNTLNGAPGTAYPLGTALYPVDNLPDALSIASANGRESIDVLADLTITSLETIDGLIITSESWPVITLDPGVPMENTVFERVSIYGEFEGFWNILNDCWTYTVTNFTGWVRGGSISDVTLAPGTGIPEEGVSFFDDLVPLFPGVPASITMNTDTDISIARCADHIILKNCTAGSIVTVGLLGGYLTIDASCTGGNIVISGTGSYVNNSAVVITVDPNYADIQKVNGVTVTGTGVLGDEWGPV